ncbi:MAG: hypothetical protein ACSHW1_17040 [Yoonia sp.]|uniref:hypothetical protein n=1 Tax=Yoonia sp. TaxID=2212373 RepID=UPI003EF0C5E9
MARTLYLHIGHYKTGTSALQAILSRNAKKLRRNGLHYVEKNRKHAKHSKLAFSLLHAISVTELMYGYSSDATPQAVWKTLFDDVKSSPADAVLVSTEEFMRLGAHPDAVAILREIVASVRGEIDIKVIAYLRGPQAHLESWYNQLIKMNKMPVPPFNTAVREVMEPVHYDYELALAPWIEIFGPEAMIVRTYSDALRQEGALIRDFLSIFGLDPNIKLDLPEADVNPRLPRRNVEIRRVMQLAGALEVDIERACARADLTAKKFDRGRDQDFSAVQLRARDALNRLQETLGPSVNLSDLLNDLPQPHEVSKQDVEDLSNLVMFLAADIQVLRTNMHQRQADLMARVAALEDALPLKKSR